MINRILTALLAVTLMFSLGARAESPHLIIDEAPRLVRPGKAERIVFTAAHEGLGSLSLQDLQGTTVAVIHPGFELMPGSNQFIWNGFDNQMQPIKPGQYQIVLQAGDDRAYRDVQVGEPSPQVTQLLVQDARVVPGQSWNMSIQVNMPGKLTVVFHVADKHYEIFGATVPQGSTQVNWDGLTQGEAPPAGLHTLSIVFLDEGGYPANQQQLMVEVTAMRQQTTPTPVIDNPETAAENMEAAADDTAVDEGTQTSIPEDLAVLGQDANSSAATTSVSTAREVQYAVPTTVNVPEADHGKDFWRLPVGKFDEDAIWRVMMQDITVLWGKDQRETYKLRATRDDSTKRDNIVGEIGYQSQGVHIIEQYDDGWSLVEAYNSSYGPDNRTRRGYGDTDDLIQGYVRTSELKVITPREDYGILIDKLKQRMYVFKDGKVFTELLISTGVPTRQQPWNETPSGEFLMVSRVGDFTTGNLVCRMAMRVNGGALIHEVPYIVNQSTGYWDYSSQERQLGQKASHGCIRVQRLNNNDGINMTWLWSNIKLNTKVLIWDDDHRFYEYPDDNLALYYNPDGGKFYHLDQNCSSIKDRFLPLKGQMNYLELDSDAFQKLTPCAHCHPPLRFSEIEKLNIANGF